MTLADSITNYASTAGRERSAVDEDAFEVIYAVTARPLWAYLARVSGGLDAADDLLQETYCRFLARRPGGLAMSEDETRSYLFRIATNLLRDRWRRGEDAGDAVADEDLDMPEAARDEAARMDVRRTMLAMKPRERQLLWLAYVEGMSHAEIAAVTGLRALSVRILLFRARRRAAALLQPDRMVRG